MLACGRSPLSPGVALSPCVALSPGFWHCPLVWHSPTSQTLLFSHGLCILSPLKVQMFFPQSVPTSSLCIYGLADPQGFPGGGLVQHFGILHFASLRSFQILSRISRFSLDFQTVFILPLCFNYLSVCIIQRLILSPANLPTTL